jgi:hypothetical protein
MMVAEGLRKLKCFERPGGGRWAASNGYDVIPGRCHRVRAMRGPMTGSRIEPGISRFPDAQFRICGLVLVHHPGMTSDVESTRMRG